MHSSDDKIVSISFNNKQFLTDISTTIKALEELNDATSGKKLSTQGVDNLEKAFTDLDKTASGSIDSINSKLKDDSSIKGLSSSVTEASSSFSILEGIALGALFSIGNAAVDIGKKITSALTSGIRGGWQEYNLQIDSTQTILANTERYGTTLSDVTAALDELNEYADKTIYNFSQMTHNIGLFTTAGLSLEDSVTAIKGMSNLAALFGVNNTEVAAATYQMSQAMSSGYIRLMDWMSMERRGMGGKLLQEELIKTAAIMSGKSVDAFKEYIGYSRGFRNTLESNWLTADVFLETMRKFAGESREYWESLTASNGERLYSDEDIDTIMHIGSTAEEAATKVRTFKMMMDSVAEAIGSSWAQSFRILFGNLEEAKEFWTPINEMIAGEHGIITSIANFRNSVLSLWADMYRASTIDDLMQYLEGINDILRAIGAGFVKAFGRPGKIAQQIGLILEPLSDLAYTLRLDEDELQDITDLVAGLLAPFTLVADVIREVVRIFFNAGDAMNEFDTRTGSLVDTLRPIRKAILNVLGAVGRAMTKAVELIRRLGVVQKSLRVFGAVIKTLATIIYNVVNTIFAIIRNVWNRYNLTERLIGFYNSFMDYVYSLKPYISELVSIFTAWFEFLNYNLLNIDFTPFEDLVNILNGLRYIFVALTDPTIEVSDAIDKFRQIVSNTSLYKGLLLIKTSFIELYNALKASSFGPIFEAIETQADGFEDKLIRVFSATKKAIEQFYSYIMRTRIGDYIRAFRDNLIDMYHDLQKTEIGRFILEIADKIKNAINSLKESLTGTDIGNTISYFVSVIRNTLSSSDTELQEPNVFTFVKDVVTKIKDVVDGLKTVNLKPIENVVDSVKTASDKVREVATGWMPDELVAKTAEGGPKLIAVLESSVQFIHDLTALGLGQVDLEDKISKLSDRLSFLSSPDREKDVDKINRISEILRVLFSALRTLILSFASFGLILIAINTSLSFKAIADAIENFTGGFEEWAKSRKYNAISNIFDAIFKLALVLIAGVYLLSTVDDFSKVKDTFMFVTSSILLILGTCIIGIELIMLSFRSLSSMENPLQALSNSRDLARVIDTIGGFLRTITGLIFRLAFIALTVSKLSGDQQEVFFNAMRQMTGIFIMVASAVAIITGLIFFFSRSLEEVDSTARLWNRIVGIRTSNIESAANAMSTVCKALSGFMFVIAASMALIMLAAPDAGMIWSAGGVLILLFGVLTTFTWIIMNGIFSFDEARMLALEKLGSVLGVLSTFIIAAAGGVTLLILAMSILTTALKGASFFDILGLVAVLAVIFGGLLIFMEEAFAMSQAIGRNMAKSTDMVIIAASVGVVALAVVAIINALIPLATLFYIEGFIGKIIVSAIIVMGMLAGLATTLMVMARLSNRYAFAASNLLFVAGSIMMIASTLIIITSSIVSLSLLPLDKMLGASAVIVGIFMVMGGILAGISALAVINPAAGGIAGGVLLAIGAAMLMMGGAILSLGIACRQAATGLILFSTGLKMLGEVDAGAVVSNVITMFEVIPEFFATLLANFVVIKASVLAFFDVLGAGISQVIRQIFGTINNLIAEFLSQGVFIFIDLFDRLFPAILVSVHNNLVVFNQFMAAECGPGGTLRQLIINLGDFLVWAGGYLAEFSVDIISAIIGGLVTALSNTYIFDRLAYTIVDMFMNIKYRIWQDYGIASWSDLGALIGNALVNGFMGAVSAVQSWYSRFMGNVATGLAEMARTAGDEDAAAIHEAVAEDYFAEAEAYSNSAQESFDQIHQYSGQLREENRQAMENEMAGWRQVAEESEARWNGTRNQNDSRYDAERAANSYDPSRYYAAQAGNDEYVNAGGKSGEAAGEGFISSFMSVVSGESEGRSLLDILGLGGITEGLSDIGEESGSGGIFGNLFSLGNTDLSHTIGDLDSIQNMDFSNLDAIDPDKIQDVDYTEFSGALENASKLPEDVSNPVITPVIDDKNFNMGIDKMVDTWNNKTYDAFALDVGNSMTLREQAEGDASTSGDVSYSYTQINYSNKDLTRTELYLDNKNLLRGYGNFRLT